MERLAMSSTIFLTQLYNVSQTKVMVVLVGILKCPTQHSNHTYPFATCFIQRFQTTTSALSFGNELI